MIKIRPHIINWDHDKKFFPSWTNPWTKDPFKWRIVWLAWWWSTSIFFMARHPFGIRGLFIFGPGYPQ